MAGLSAPSPAWRCTRDRFCTGPIAGGGNPCLQTQSSVCRPLVRLDALPAPEPGELLGCVQDMCTHTAHAHVCGRAHTHTGTSGCCDHCQRFSRRRTQSRGGWQTPCLVPRVRPCPGPGALADHVARIQAHGCPPASLLITGRGKGPGQ